MIGFERRLLVLSLIFGLTSSVSAGDVKKEDVIRRTLRFSGSGQNELVLDNVNGSISVVGYSGKEVELVAKHVVRGRSESSVRRGLEDVKLDIEENGEIISLYVDGPFRDRNGSINYKGWRHYGYEVSYDFDLKVPFNTAVYLKTVNDGEIYVRDLVGSFDVNNINGGIEMQNINGSGRVYALNGSVEVTFAENPKEDSYFGSLNGDVDVSFRSGFSADIRIKTFNGEAYSDFPFRYRAAAAVKGERRRGKYVYKSNRGASLRIGEGGPEIEFDGFNGDIRIYEERN